jgi:hypothetical protein
MVLVQKGAVESPFVKPVRRATSLCPALSLAASVQAPLTLLSRPRQWCPERVPLPSWIYLPTGLLPAQRQQQGSNTRTFLFGSRRRSDWSACIRGCIIYIPHAPVGRLTWKIRIAPRHAVSKQH